MAVELADRRRRPDRLAFDMIQAGHGGADTPLYPIFSASLTYTLIPEIAGGSYTSTYSRSTTAYDKDNVGDYILAAINEARFRGAYRVSSGVYSPNTAAGAAIPAATLWGYEGEQASTNYIRNNSAQGIAAGTPGTPPTNSAITIVTTTGLTTSVGAAGTENGIDYWDVTVAGTASGAGSFQVFFETTTGIAGVQNDIFSGSVFWKLTAGSLTGLTAPVIGFDEYSAVPTFLASQTISASAPTSAALSSQRQGGAVTLANALTATVRPYIQFTIADAAVVNVTIRIGWPQCEMADVPTSPIRTTTVAVARTADSLTYASAGNANEVEGTMYCEAISEFIRSVAGNVRSACSFARSTATNFEYDIQYQRAASGNTLATIVNSTAQANFALSGVVVNQTRRMAMAYQLNNSNAAFDGVAQTLDTACTMPTSLTTIYIGRNDAGSTDLNGCVKNVRFYPRRLTDAQLAALR